MATNYLDRFGFDEWIQRVKAAKTHAEHEALGREMADKIESAYSNESTRKKPIAAIRKATLAALDGASCPSYLGFSGRGDDVSEQPFVMNFLFVGEPETERDRYWEKLEQQGLTDKAKQMLIDAVSSDSDTVSANGEPTKPAAVSIEPDYTDDEATAIRTAMDYKGMSREEFRKAAELYYARNIISNAEKNQQDLSKVSTQELMENKEYLRIKGRGEELAKRAIAAIIEYNNQQKSPDDRWYISSRTVADVGKVGLRAANVALNELGGHKEINKQWGLSPYHRRGDTRQITEDISLTKEETDNAA